jgi:hypothetical protein
MWHSEALGGNERKGGEEMNWKAEAKDKLRRYSAMQNALISIPQEIERLELESQSIRSSRTDGTPVKGGGSGREDAMLNNIVARQELELSLKQAKIWKETTDRALASLDDDGRLVLKRLYINPTKAAVSTLCKELGCGESTVFRKRDDALHKFTIALYGIAES